jgi:hypothetical protein
MGDMTTVVATNMNSRHNRITKREIKLSVERVRGQWRGYEDNGETKQQRGSQHQYTEKRGNDARENMGNEMRR